MVGLVVGGLVGEVMVSKGMGCSRVEVQRVEVVR